MLFLGHNFKIAELLKNPSAFQCTQEFHRKHAYTVNLFSVTVIVKNYHIYLGKKMFFF